MILCLDSLEHNDNYESLVLNLTRALKKDGILIIAAQQKMCYINWEEGFQDLKAIIIIPMFLQLRNFWRKP